MMSATTHSTLCGLCSQSTVVSNIFQKKKNPILCTHFVAKIFGGQTENIYLSMTGDHHLFRALHPACLDASSGILASSGSLDGHGRCLPYCSSAVPSNFISNPWPQMACPYFLCGCSALLMNNDLQIPQATQFELPTINYRQYHITAGQNACT